MFIVSNFRKYYFDKINFLNFLICLIPFSLVLGNLATNLNIILICIFGFLSFKKEIFFFEDKKKYLIYLFFIYLILTTSINNLAQINKDQIYLENILKSFFYLRFLIFFLVINKLIEKKKFYTRIFFLSCAIISLIVSIDLIIQFIFKKNILGYPTTLDRPSSFFKEENIAGGFLQKFLLFLIFFVATKKKSPNNLDSFILLMFLIFFIPVIITGNKMPTLLFIMCMPLYFLLEKKYNKIIISFLIILSIIFFISKYETSDRLKSEVSAFVLETKELIQNAPKLFFFNEKNPNYVWHTGYIIHFNTGIQLWKENMIFGYGLKSFRIKCSYSEEKYLTCNTHPHNYFIELLVDTGLVGVLIIYSFFFIGVISFIQYYFKEKNINARLTSCVFFLLIFCEFFPIRSSGSFFTTNNSVFIFLILSIFLNIKKLKKL